MRWSLDTITGRTILVLLVGMGAVLILSHLVYEIGLKRELREYDAARLADRLIVLKQSITRLQPDARDTAAHALSGGPIFVHWGKQRLATADETDGSAAATLRESLLKRTPTLANHGLVIGSGEIPWTDHPNQKSADNHHVVLISMGLDDGSWINMSLATLTGSSLRSPSFLFSTLALAGGAILVAIFMARWLTRPLSALTAAARRTYSGVERELVPQVGPVEVRELGQAFNEMQERIGRLIEDRTQTLAAISHDLRTPLTRLRLRVEEMTDEATKRSVTVDIDEMEAMIDATLAFLKGDLADEEIETIDVVAILETITNDMSDAGSDVTLSGLRHAVTWGRRLALKRAFTNLMQNAVKYGRSARISVAERGSAIEVTIEDDGPGIPPDELEAVFAPFYRVEGSRSRETGGHGLGLTVARRVVRAHGGDVSLHNRAPNGLTVLVVLPVRASA